MSDTHDKEKNVEEIITIVCNTDKLLAACYKHGIRKVAIRCFTPEIQSCQAFRSHNDDWSRFSAFADEREHDNDPNRQAGDYYRGWPSIWRAVEESGVGGGCGNGGQQQLLHSALLIDGYYVYERNKWKRKYGREKYPHAPKVKTNL